LQARFSESRTIGTSPLTVQFRDLSSGSPQSWSWKFGDGYSSIQENPSHTYRTPGVYTVSLTVSDGTTAKTTVHRNVIRVFSL
jgi:PKD repeat protein